MIQENSWENLAESGYPSNETSMYWVKVTNGEIQMAYLNLYPSSKCFQDLSGNDEGMEGFKVSHYIELTRPTSPSTEE
tara:strand:- start:1336 stop:1569 length:234 start_codon:yes stop_codon:yes gene_type:complete